MNAKRMVACNDCGAEISTAARACPRCGAQRQTRTYHATRMIWGGVVLLVLSAGMVRPDAPDGAKVAAGLSILVGFGLLFAGVIWRRRVA